MRDSADYSYGFSARTENYVLFESQRVWVREGDLVIVKLWDFQPSKGDLAWRYLPNQANYLKRKGLLEGLHYDK